MSRPTVARMSAVNITVHPHHDGIYSELIRAVRRRKIIKQVWGHRSGIFTQVWNSPDPQLPGIHGQITTFVDFDPDQPWFDVETSDAASEEELNRLEVPDNLRPDMRRCDFILDERRHIFSFNCDTSKGGITALNMKKFLDKVFGDEFIVERYGRVAVHVVHPERTIDELFELPSIREIFIHATRPNIGDYDDTPFANLNEWMKDQNLSTFEQRQVAEGGDMEPKESVKELAKVADENGFVIVKGKDARNETVTLSTKDSAPLEEQEHYNADITNAISAFYMVAQKIAAAIRRRRQR